MPQKTRGATKLLDTIRADFAELRRATKRGRDLAIFNPDFARDRFHEVDGIVDRIERLIREDLEPLLERQAPQYEKRLAELEERMARLENAPRPVPLARRMGGE